MTRRELFLSGAAAGAAARLPALAAAARPAQKIASMEVFVVKVNVRGNWIFVRLKTDKGLTGLGEASQGGGFRGEGDATMQSQLGRFFEPARDLSPLEIELYRQRGRERAKAGGRMEATAFSAIEQAMWDLAGKSLGAPVCELLGGPLRKTVPVYANINRATNEDRSPQAFAANAKKAAGEGFKAVKAAVFDDFPRLTAPPAEIEKFKELGIARVEAMRKAIGPEVDLLIDVHSHFDVPLAIEVAKRLEPQNLFWYEEPVNPERLDDTKKIHDAVKQRLAGGEVLFGMEGFAPLTRGKALHVIMPDVKHCGGILEAKKIAAVAELDGVAVAPHNPSGPVAMAASVQLCAGLSNFLILEYAWGEASWRPQLVTPQENFVNGRIEMSMGPGFGIELNEKVVHAHT